MDNEVWLTVDADLHELGDIRDFIEEVASTFHASAEVSADLALAVTELVTNIIVHGYKGQKGSIEIGISCRGDSVMIRLVDHAPVFNPTLLPEPDLSLPLEQRPFGGMGIFLTSQLVDVINHRTTPQGGNELLLVKKGVAC